MEFYAVTLCDCRQRLMSLRRSPLLPFTNTPTHLHYKQARYSTQPAVVAKSASARGSYLRTHFKNTYETAMAIKGMPLKKAVAYLNAVKDMKQCIPFRRFRGGIGRTPQGILY